MNFDKMMKNTLILTSLILVIERLYSSLNLYQRTYQCFHQQSFQKLIQVILLLNCLVIIIY